MKILIAEDDSMTRMALSKNIEKWGHEVIAVPDGLKASEILYGAAPPRLAILDWIMPEKEGIEICRELGRRTEGPMIYTILLTIKKEKSDIIEALDCGAHDFLSKPVHTGELRSRIAVGVRLVEAEDKLVNYAKELENKNNALERALAEIKTLRGFLPICCHCKKIRDDKGYWQQIEQYVRAHTEAEFSHGICPECLDKHYPDIARRLLNRQKGQQP